MIEERSNVGGRWAAKTVILSAFTIAAFHFLLQIISTGFVESTVNELVTRRTVKKQQMRWTKQDAHLLLQNRVKTLNHELLLCESTGTGNLEEAEKLLVKRVK